MKQKLMTLFLVGFGLTTLQAQENLGSAGGGVSGTNGTLYYTLGQVVCNTSINSSGSIVHGVLQPYGISEETGLEEVGINLNISVYPNPTTHNLILRVDNYDHRKLSYELYTSAGKLVEVREFANSEILIDMSGLSPSIYFLKTIFDEKEIKSFKIIKNN